MDYTNNNLDSRVSQNYKTISIEFDMAILKEAALAMQEGETLTGVLHGIAATVDENSVDIYKIDREDGGVLLTPWKSYADGELDEFFGARETVEFRLIEGKSYGCWIDKSGRTYTALLC